MLFKMKCELQTGSKNHELKFKAVFVVYVVQGLAMRKQKTKAFVFCGMEEV